MIPKKVMPQINKQNSVKIYFRSYTTYKLMEKNIFIYLVYSADIE